MAAWLVSVAIQLAIVTLLARKRVYKQLPLFFSWLLWAVLSDLVGMTINSLAPGWFLKWYLYEMPLDCVLQFGVLVELAWSVLRPVRAALPRWTVFVLGGIILLGGVVVWPIAGTTVMHDLAPQWHLLLRLQQTFSILRVLFFVLLAAGSQLLSLSWHDRELQIATGLGFYSLVSLATGLLHAQMFRVAHYHRIDQLMIAGYLCSLVYWMVSFAQKEAPRQEFTPEMRNFLLTVSGAARSGRIALQDNGLHGNGPR